MIKNKFISDLILTSATSVILTVLGMAFRVYISNKVGAECMGLYQLIYAVYIPACTIASSGINIATVRLISAKEAKQEADTWNIIKHCFVYSLMFGLFAFAVLFFGAKPAGIYLLKTEESVSCLKILSFGLPFLSAANVINGYFTAKRKIVKTLLIQISEDLSKIAVTVTALYLFKEKTSAELCTVLVLGSAAGEILSCFVAFAFFLTEKGRKIKEIQHKESFGKLFTLAFPTAVSAYVRSGLSSLENMLVPFGYRKYGYSQEETLYHIGVFRGMVFPLMTFPAALLNAAAKLLVPEISYAYEQKDRKKIESIAVKAIYSTLLFSIFISVIFLFFSNDVCTALYNNEEAAVTLKLLAALIPILYLDGIIDAMLKGINEQIATMRYSITDSVISVILILILLPKFGVHGYIAVTYISSSVNTFMGIARFLKITDIKFSVYKGITLPILCAVTAVFPIFVFKNVVSTIALPTAINIVISSILYATFLIMMKSEASTKKSYPIEHFRSHSETLSPFKTWMQH